MSLEDELAQERRARQKAEQLVKKRTQQLARAQGRLSQLTKSIPLGTRTEGRIWAAIESINDSFAIYDDENRLVVANSPFKRLFAGLSEVKPGMTYDRLLELCMQEGIIDTEGVAPDAWIAEMLERWASPRIPNKTIRLFNGMYIKLIDRRVPNGDVVSLSLNVTELMRMWAAVEAVPDGFVLFDRDDKLVICNERYREIYHESAPAMMPGTKFEDILRFGAERGQYHGAKGRVEEWISERMEAHNRLDRPIEQQLNDGRWLRILEQETPDGGRVGLRVDISEQKEQQRALQLAKAQAESAIKAKTAFFANMSHELRTPMNGVVGMAELLSETTLSEEQHLYAETIRSSGETLLSMLNDVLDFSKIEAGKMSLDTEAFDFERTVHEVSTLLQATARDKDVSFYVDYDMFLPSVFKGDKGRLRQILTNLIGNAIKFTEQGYVLVRVVGGKGNPNGPQSIHVTVEDTGIGIRKDKQAHIFGEFNQVEDEQNRKFGGTGLGLAITKQLVEMMDGEIWVESDLGKGACFGFRIELPVVEQAKLAIPNTEGLSGLVFVIDDEQVNRTILDRQLTQLGMRTSLFSNAQHAIDALQHGASPCLIISDEHMPEMNGRRLAQTLHGMFSTHIPFLLLSSDLSEGKGDGVDTVLSKPVLRPRLTEAIQKLLSNATDLVQDVRRMKVLTAEDNRTNQIVFSAMAKDLNIDLQFVENGHDAIAAFLDDRPDLIFMDVSMPEMDGKEATRKIREFEVSHGLIPVPICALTAHALPGDQAELLAIGMDDYLTKPLKRDLLRAVVQRAHEKGNLSPLDKSAMPLQATGTDD